MSNKTIEYNKNKTSRIVNNISCRHNDYKQCEICYSVKSQPITKFFSESFSTVIPVGGVYRHIFNTSEFTLFTILVANNSTVNITGFLEVSPNGIYYMKDWSSPLVIKPNALEAFVAGIFMNYTVLNITGLPNSNLFISIQGQY